MIELYFLIGQMCWTAQHAFFTTSTRVDFPLPYIYTSRIKVGI